MDTFGSMSQKVLFNSRYILKLNFKKLIGGSPFVFLTLLLDENSRIGSSLGTG